MDSPNSPTGQLTEQLLGEVAFVHRLARALLRDAEAAHDVAQDALAAALQQGPMRHVRGWLAAVTRHLAGRTRREARERAAREARAARPPAHDGEERTAERLRLHRRLTDAVMALPEPYRTAVTLRFFDELSPRAIAQRLRLPAATVRQHLHRGLAMLRQQLDGEFGGRDRWQAAFAAIALGEAAVPALLWIPVLAMKKVAVALLVAAVAAGWWALDPDKPAPGATPAATPAAPVTAIAAATSEPPGEPAALRTPVATLPARSEAMVVLVVDERNEPVAGADVHRWTIAGALTKQRTDRDGRAEFAALDEAGGLLVRADGWTPLARELDRLRGELTCSLPDGCVLDGQMLVDGAPAPAGLRLRFRTHPALPPSAPRELREEFADHRPAVAALTAAGGTFVFRGLEAGRDVTLELPRTHWFVPEDGLIDERRDSLMQRTLAPAHRVLLRTTQLPTVHGRVVWADDGTAVDEPRLMVSARFADGTTPLMGCSGNHDGTFAAGFYPSSPNQWLRWADPSKRSNLASVQLSADADGSEGSTVVDLDSQALAALPLEVRLPRAAVTHFVVTDADDRPLAGARVSATPSTPTDEHGRGTFRGKRDKVLVGADGHQVQPALSHRPAAGTADDPLRFRLAPRNRLVMNVRAAAGGVPPLRSVRINSPCDLFFGKRFHGAFDDEFGGSDANCGRTGRTQSDGRTEWYEFSCRISPDADGRIELHSLEPGLQCTAIASDGFDAEIASASFTTPPAGETVTLDLVVQGTARTVRGRVQARSGTPIEALVELYHDKRRVETRAKADGTFTFAGVYGDGPFELKATATGYANVRSPLATADASTGLVLVLEPGQRVTLRVVDHEGKPVVAGVTAELSTGDDAQKQTLQAGEHLFTDLPSGVVTFVCVLGGKRFTLAHDTANPNAVLTVPRPARIVVAQPEGTPWTTALGARLTRLDGAGGPFEVRIGESDTDAEPVVPGRYRVELVRYSWRGQGEQRERVVEVVAPAQEIDAKAGELVRVKF